MLTIRKIRVASGDLSAARRTAEYVVDAADSPEAFARVKGDRDRSTGRGRRHSALWLGSAPMLERLGVEHRADVSTEELTLALQGRNVRTGDRIRTEGMIQQGARDERGRPIYDDDGRRVKVRVPGTKSVDLTFSAPKSVSVVWSQADPGLRVEIEAAMLAAANAMLETMTQTKPVVAFQRALHPARGFVAAAALHVMARAARGEPVPSPQLHVHGIVLGVERDDGFFASPELSGMFKYGAPLEGGAVARVRLAEGLVDLGFEIVRAGRFFEIGGVPKRLIERMSGRTRDVDARISVREQAKGKSLSARERAVAAMETRLPKGKEASLERAAAAWAAHAAELGFVPAAVDSLRSGRGFSVDLDGRLAAVTAAVAERTGRDGPASSIGAARAVVLECAAGRLRLGEVLPLLGGEEALAA